MWRGLGHYGRILSFASYSLVQRVKRAQPRRSGEGGDLSIDGTTPAERNAHIGNQLGGTAMTRKEARDLTRQRIDFRILPYVSRIFTGLNIPRTGFTFTPAHVTELFARYRRLLMNAIE